MHMKMPFHVPSFRDRRPLRAAESGIGSAGFRSWQSPAIAPANVWKSKHAAVFQIFGQEPQDRSRSELKKKKWKKMKTHPNDNRTYRLLISCFAKSTQIGLMYHHNPRNTECELPPHATASWSLCSMWEIVTLWFSFTDSGLSWHVKGQPAPKSYSEFYC